MQPLLAWQMTHRAQLYKNQYKEEKKKRQIILSSIITEGILKEAEGNEPTGI